MHIITSLLRGGAEMALLRLLESLDRSRIESRIVSLGPRGPVAEEIEALGFPIGFMDMRARFPGIKGFATLLRDISGFRPHILQGWMYHANLVASAGALRLGGSARTIWGIRQSLSESLGGEKPSTRRVIQIGAKLSWMPSALVYNSQTALRAHTCHGYRAGRAKVIPNGFDPDKLNPRPGTRSRVRRELGIGEDEIVIGLVGRYHPIKDHAGFLEAARLAEASGLRARYLLAGRDVDRSNGELRSLIAAKSLEGSVIALGERRDVPELLVAMDLLASTSRSEAFSNAIGEAMACGVPCAVTDVGDSRLLIGDAGTVVPAGDPAAMADAWIGLLDADRAGLRALGEKARARIRERFSIVAMSERYLGLYHELAGGTTTPCAA
jgi:glycosyltransferase involved in cell wall biosynthesis